MKKRTRVMVALLGLLAIGIGAAGLSWACTRQELIRVDPPFGRAGTQTRVTGGAFLTGEPVELRWNAATGPVIGNAFGPDFSVMVTVPAGATPGVYYIVATAPASRAAASYEVITVASQTQTEEPQKPQTDETGQGFDYAAPTGGPTSGTTEGGVVDPANVASSTGELGFAEPERTPVPNPVPAPAGPTNTNTNTNTSGTGTGTSTSGGVGLPAAAGTASPLATSNALSPATSTAGSAAPATASQPAFAAQPALDGVVSAPQVVAGALPNPVVVPGVAGDERLTQRAPTARTALADLWSGFSTANLDSQGLYESSSAPTRVPVPAIALTVMVVGLVATSGGFAVAEAFRRRSTAQSV